LNQRDSVATRVEIAILISGLEPYRVQIPLNLTLLEFKYLSEVTKVQMTDRRPAAVDELSSQIGRRWMLNSEFTRL